VVERTALPSASVEDRTTGTSTPLISDELTLELADRVPAVIAAEVVVIELPAESVVVTGVTSETLAAEDTTTDDSTVLPSEFVVVIGTVVGAIDVIPFEEVDEPPEVVLSPADVVAPVAEAVVSDSVVREMAVVDESETMTGTVVEAEVVSELVAEVTVPLVFCRFRSSALTATSCFAISTNLLARVGFSLWICSMARLSASKTPSWYCGPKWPWRAACRDSDGRSSSSCLKSFVSIKSRLDCIGSG